MADSTATREEQIQLISSSNHPAIDDRVIPAYTDTALPASAHQDDRFGDTWTENTAFEYECGSYRQHQVPYVGQSHTVTDNHFRGHPWRSGLWASFPHRGFWALFGCLASTISCIIILLECDGKPQADWSVPPTVYVAALTAVTNTLARFAFATGVKITWWRTAIKGASFADLHHRWSHADGFLSAFFAGRHFNLIALSCIAVTIIVVDQPLIQRAVGVISVQVTSRVEIGVAIAPEIPWGYTGYQNGRVLQQQAMTQPMISVLNDYNSKFPIKPSLSGCRGNCTGFIEAGGLASQCNSTTRTVNYFNLTSEEAQHEAIDRPESPFSVSFGLDNAILFDITLPPRITAHIAYSENSKEGPCEAMRTERTCHLVSATIRYPVTISQGAISLGDTSSDSSVVSLQPKNTDGRVDQPVNSIKWTLGGMYLAADMMFSSNATYKWGGALYKSIEFPDSMSSQFLNVTSPPQDPTAGVQKLQNLTIPPFCAANWTDPTNFILSNLNTMAFMLSISAANFEYRDTNATPPLRTWPMQETRLVNVYKVEYSYLFASTAITFGLVMLIMPTFLGWWELGRSVTLNPVEMAKAFDAPLLSGPGSNAPLKELVRAAGEQKVRYGDMSGIEEKANGWRVVRRQLVFRAADEVTTPKNGFVYE